MKSNGYLVESSAYVEKTKTIMRDNCFYFLLATKQLVSGIQTHKLKFKILWQ